MLTFVNKKKPTQEAKSASSTRLGQATSEQSSKISSILHLSRTIGNQTALQLLRYGTIQAKLQISQPGDEYEREADRVAEQVMRMPDAALSEPVTGDAQPQISRLQRKCDQCEEEEVQRQPMEEKEEEEPLQAKEAPGQTPEIASGMRAQIDGLRDGGEPLPGPVRAFFEPRFGRDFSQVRVHTGSRATELAQSLHARALTFGSDIVFDSGQYAPSSYNGDHLLAHELAHVIQQSGATGEAAKDGVVQRAPSFDECTPAQEKTVQASHDRAHAMLSTAVAKLMAYDGTNPPEVRTALATHFHTTSKLFAFWAAGRYMYIGLQSDSPQYECESGTEGRGWSLWCTPFSDIELRKDWFADPDIDMRARTMIHEWFHRYGCNLDLGYHSSEEYGSHGTARAIMNADSWAWFTVDVR